MADLLTLTDPLTGCAVTQRGAGANMSVDVAAGSVLVTNASVSVASGNLAIAIADINYDRIDAVVVNSSGVASVLTGAISDGGLNPQPPDATGYALLANVYVFSQSSSRYTGTIVTAAITDLRQTAFALIHTSPYRVSGLWYGVPGNGASIAGWTDQDMYLAPFFTAKALPLQTIGCRTTTPAATAGSKARLGIYADDGSGGLSLFLDAGQVAVDGGVATPSVAIGITLTPGWWWLTIAFQSLGATKPTMFTLLQTLLALSPIGGNTLTDITNGRVGSIKFSGIAGALPATPTSPTYSPNPTPGVWVQAT
jgi:hypothetical protein